MNRGKLNYFVDVFMALAFLVVSITGMVLFFNFPSGERTGRLVLGGLSKHQWIDVHNWAGILIIALVLVHLILHCRWIVAMTKDIFKKKV